LAGVENNIARWQTAEGRIVERPANFLLSAGDSETTDAPADFLQPLRPGAKGQYVLRAKTGDVIATTSCAIGRLGRTTGPAGQFDSIEAICHEERAGHPAIERHFTYAPELRLVIREETRIEGAQTRMRELVALRPSTQSWPKAAQIGLDWALSHALDESNSKTPLRWSSTAVKEHFTIRIDNATPLVVSSTVNNARCMRFELESGDGDFAHARYPGLACKSLSGPWVIPASSPVTIAYPNQGMAPRSAAAAQPATPQ
jgi:hypothetical protein